MELKEYWLAVRRGWRIILASVALVVGIALIIVWRTTPLYTSTSGVFVSTNPENIADAYQGNLFAAARMSSYADLVGGRPLAARVADDLGGDLTAAELQSKVTSSVQPNTVLLNITATDADPAVARDVAQAYASALREEIVELETPDGQSRALVAPSIVDAQVSSSPVNREPVRSLGLAVVLGLLIGIAIVVVRYLLDTTLRSADDVGNAARTPVLGTIPADPRAARLSPVEGLTVATPWSEAYRILRTNLQYVDTEHGQKLFVVTSTLPGEGRTITAINLAITLAQADKRVVLVECDLRRPQIASRLDLDGSIGVTSVLSGDVDLDEALQQYAGTSLRVVTSGPISPNPSELLQSHAMEKLLYQLRNEFDVAIIDAPPLLPLTDAALLAAQADGALVVVRHAKTTRVQLRDAIERFDAVGAKAVGVVVNLAPRKERSYGYGYGHTYSYSPAALGGGRMTRARSGRRRGGRTRRS